jgi:hypothetical protein
MASRGVLEGGVRILYRQEGDFVQGKSRSEISEWFDDCRTLNFRAKGAEDAKVNDNG